MGAGPLGAAGPGARLGRPASRLALIPARSVRLRTGPFSPLGDRAPMPAGSGPGDGAPFPARSVHPK